MINLSSLTLFSFQKHWTCIYIYIVCVCVCVWGNQHQFQVSCVGTCVADNFKLYTVESFLLLGVYWLQYDPFFLKISFKQFLFFFLNSTFNPESAGHAAHMEPNRSTNRRGRLLQRQRQTANLMDHFCPKRPAGLVPRLHCHVFFQDQSL